ncbi:MAG: molybdopterin dinucleotide binding domain-containing protein, partial [Acidimicrobiia bacterium]
PFGQYTPAIVPRPDGVIDDWEFYLRLAWAMGRTMSVAGRDYPPGSPMPTTDEVLASFAARARVPLEEIRAAPHGKVFEELPPVHAAPESENASATFDVAPSDVVAEIAATAAALAQGDRRERPLLLIVRRAKNVMNSTGKQVAGLARDPQNPCHGHPDDLAELGLRAGQEIVIESDHGAIEAVIEADATLRRGVVSMSHSFGGLPGTDDDPKRFGSNINRILTMDSDIQPISAMPLMTAVPVTIRALVAAG